MRSTPSSAHSRNPSGSPLPAISEDGTSSTEPRRAPPIPLRASNRPANKHFGLGAPPRHSYDSPPAYSHFSFDDDGERPNAEKLAAARNGMLNNKHIAKRGGWKRLLIIAIIVALCIVGLVVGLVIGLRNRHKSLYGIPSHIIMVSTDKYTETEEAQAQQAARQETHQAAVPTPRPAPPSRPAPTHLQHTSQSSPQTAPPTPQPGPATPTQRTPSPHPAARQPSNG